MIIAFSEADHEELLKTIRELRKLDVQIDVVPRLFEIVGPKAGIHTFEGLALVGLPPARISPSSRLLKRALDYVVALAMLVLLAPVMLLIALAIRLDSPGPVLFRQRRLGRDMRPFTVLKFRTMRVGHRPGGAPPLHREHRDAPGVSEHQRALQARPVQTR